MDRVRRRAWIIIALSLVFYYGALVAVFLAPRYLPRVDPGALAVLMLLMLPILIPFLKSIEVFGVKVEPSEALRELLAEARETKEVAQQSAARVQDLSARLESLHELARKSLQREPLDISLRRLNEIDKELGSRPLTPEEITVRLKGSAEDRIVAYRQLQLTPNPAFDDQMLKSLRAEYELAESSWETRPLWNWLEVFHQLFHKGPGVPAAHRPQLEAAIEETLAFLAAHASIDTGRHCRLSADSLRDRITKGAGVP